MMRRGVVLIVGALLLAGCASKESAPEPAAPAAPAAHGGLADCLKAHGVSDAGGPAAVLGPPAGVDAADWDKAMRDCASLAPGPAGP